MKTFFKISSVISLILAVDLMVPRSAQAQSASERAAFNQAVESHNEGLRLTRAKRDQEAVPYFNRAIELFSRLSDARTQLSQSYTQRGAAFLALEQFEPALRDFREALRHHPGNSQASEYLKLATDTQALREAQDALKTAKEARDAPGQRHLNNGVALGNQKQWKEAEAEFRQAVKLDPSNPFYTGHLGGALENQQKFSEAEAAYRQSITAKPTDNSSSDGLGRVLAAQGKMKEAEAHYRLEIQRYPKGSARVSLAGMFMDARRWKEAEAEYRALVALEPSEDTWWLRLGWALSSQQRSAEAEAAYRQAIKLDPNGSASRYGLGLSLYWQQKFAEAMTELQAVLVLEPGNVGAAADLGWMLVEEQEWPKAEAVYRAGLRLSPDAPALLSALAYVLADRGKNLEEALQLTERAAIADPSNGAYIGFRGWVHFKSGRFDEAERDIVRGAVLAPANALMQEHLGDLHRHRGRFEQARAAWEKALSLKPDRAQTARLSEKLAAAKPPQAPTQTSKTSDPRDAARAARALAIEPHLATIQDTRSFETLIVRQTLPNATADQLEAEKLTQSSLALAVKGLSLVTRAGALATNPSADKESRESARRTMVSALEDLEGLADLWLKPGDTPNRAAFYFVRGHANFGLGRYQAALEAYRQCLALKPDFAATPFNMSIVYIMLKRYDDALQSLNDAARLDPEYKTEELFKRLIETVTLADVPGAQQPMAGNPPEQQLAPPTQAPPQARSVEGTTWLVEQVVGDEVLDFLVGGKFRRRYSFSSASQPSVSEGTWKQQGNTIYVEYKNALSGNLMVYRATIKDDVMKGTMTGSSSERTWVEDFTATAVKGSAKTRR